MARLVVPITAKHVMLPEATLAPLNISVQYFLRGKKMDGSNVFASAYRRKISAESNQRTLALLVTTPLRTTQLVLLRALLTVEIQACLDFHLGLVQISTGRELNL